MSTINIEERKKEGIETITSFWNEAKITCTETSDLTLFYSIRFVKHGKLISIYIEDWYSNNEYIYIIYFGGKEKKITCSSDPELNNILKQIENKL